MNNSNSMINPPIADLLTKVDNRYSLVVATSKRARQLIEGQEALVITKSIKPVTVAIKEIDSGAITVSKCVEEVE